MIGVRCVHFLELWYALHCKGSLKFYAGTHIKLTCHLITRVALMRLALILFVSLTALVAHAEQLTVTPYRPTVSNPAELSA